MEGKKKGIIRTGTSNIVVPGNKASFPLAFQLKSRLNYYSSLFNTVEINSSFYKLPLKKTFEKWSEDVPENFQFTLKLSRDITHSKNLQADLDYINTFIKAAEGIGSKKGCILIQFPGKITLEYFEQVERIVQKLQQEDDRNEWRKAVEFRSPTWYTGETFELLDEYDASMVLHDMPKSKSTELNKKAKFVYIRFHGPTGDYKESYTTHFLKEKAEQVKDWLDAGKDVYAYFNNTIGNAFNNAVTLKNMINH